MSTRTVLGLTSKYTACTRHTSVTSYSRSSKSWSSLWICWRSCWSFLILFLLSFSITAWGFINRNLAGFFDDPDSEIPLAESPTLPGLVRSVEGFDWVPEVTWQGVDWCNWVTGDEECTDADCGDFFPCCWADVEGSTASWKKASLMLVFSRKRISL